VRRIAIALLPVAWGACADLPPLGALECGNGVVDPGEDCDRIVDPALGRNARCGAPSLGQRGCKLICETSAGCPDRWGCSAEGVCLRPDGFVNGWALVSGAPWTMPTESFTVADADGDGLADLAGFGGTSFVARYGSGDGRFNAAAAFATDFGVNPPAFGDIDGDRRVDLVVPQPTGLYAVRGSAERAPSPITYPTLLGAAGVAERFVPVRAGESERGHALLHLAGGELRVFDKLLLRDRAGEPLPDGHDTAQLAGRVAVADLDPPGRPGTARDELALAFAGERQVWILETLTVEGQLASRVRAVVPLPLAVRDGARFADLEGDGRLDLVVGVARDDGIPEPAVVTARQSADGSFAEAVLDPRFTDLLACNGSEWPLAAGDLTGDGIADYVGSRGVCVGTGAGMLLAATSQTPADWIDAELADFNHDGVNDVAAITGNTASIDFLFADPGGSGTSNHARALTEAPPGLVRAGDFNGDFIPDLAIAERSASIGRPGTQLSVVFGAPTGAAPRATPMSTFSEITALEPAELNFSTAPLDLTTDLVVAEQTGGQRALTFLIGNAQRVLAAPYPLRAGGLEEAIFDRPRVVASGDLDGNGIADAVVMAIDREAQGRLWFLPGAAARWGAAVRSEVSVPLFEPSCALTAVAPPSPHAAAVALVAQGARRCSVVPRLARVVLAGDRPAYEEIALPDDLEALNDLTLADVDGDGAPDAVLAFAGTSFVVPGAPPERAAVVVLWNRDGRFDRDAPLVIRGLPSLVAPYAAAPIEADGDAAPELAVLTADGIYLADRDAAGGWSFPTNAPLPGTAVKEGTRLVAVDLDRDGLQDLVWTGLGEAYVARAVGVSAAAARER
jgi:hypothetical protein